MESEFELVFELILESVYLSGIGIGIERCSFECIGIRIGIHVKGIPTIRIRIVIHIFPINSLVALLHE